MNLDSTVNIKMTKHIVALTTEVDHGNNIPLRQFYALAGFFAAKTGLDFFGIIYFRYVLETILLKDTGDFIVAKMDNRETYFENIGFKFSALRELATLLADNKNSASPRGQQQIQISYYQFLAIILGKYKNKPEYGILKLILNNRIPTLASVVQKLQEYKKEDRVETSPFIKHYTEGLEQGENYKEKYLEDGLDYTSVETEDPKSEDLEKVLPGISYPSSAKEIEQKLPNFTDIHSDLSKKLKRSYSGLDDQLSSHQKGRLTREFNREVERIADLERKKINAIRMETVVKIADAEKTLKAEQLVNVKAELTNKLASQLETIQKNFDDQIKKINHEQEKLKIAMISKPSDQETNSPESVPSSVSDGNFMNNLRLTGDDVFKQESIDYKLVFALAQPATGQPDKPATDQPDEPATDQPDKRDRDTQQPDKRDRDTQQPDETDTQQPEATDTKKPEAKDTKNQDA